MKVVSTSFVNGFSTSSNDVVSASYIDVENTVTMKVVSTSFVNVLSTSSNDVVSASYIDVETTSKTRLLWKLDRHQLSTFCRRRVTTLFRRHILTSKQRRRQVAYESWIDVSCQRFADVE